MYVEFDLFFAVAVTLCSQFSAITLVIQIFSELIEMIEKNTKISCNKYKLSYKYC